VSSPHQQNNFNLIRILAAFAVLVSHSLPLSGTFPDTIPFGSSIIQHAGEWAVNIFFAISGFLVAASYPRQHSCLNFMRARAYRIFPALFINCIFSALIIGPFFTTLSLGDYLSDSEVYKYIIKNSFLIHTEYTLPGVFTETAYGPAVNGSLWSLRYEAKMYLILAALGVLGIYHNRLFFRFMLILFSLLWVIHTYWPQVINDPEDYRIIKRVSLYFFIGCLLQKWEQHYKLSWLYAAAFCGIAFICKDFKFAPFINTLTVVYTTLCVAYLPTGKIRQFNSYSDISYGYYLYAFPIQQTLMYLYPGTNFYSMVIIAGLTTWLLAYLSWHFVEKPALNRCKNLNKGLVSPRFKVF